jgi:probable rRNA maturation factor
LNKKILFFTQDVLFSLRNRTTLRKWIAAAIKKEGFSLSSLNYIFCNDEYLLSMNISHLHHKTYTDIITFNLSSEKKKIEGEIYISIDRVKENAVIYKVPFNTELKRVLIHGVLHLCGFKDKTGKEAKKMRMREDFYLQQYKK